jgi:predicted amidohydrolase
MILAAAQTKPKREDITANLLDHYRLIELAAGKNVNLIVFPEMSITGYERERAEGLAFYPEDTRLDKLKELAAKYKIIIVAGAPIKINSNLFIGEFILFPDKSEQIYTKQFLHPGEEIYFIQSFEYNPTIKIENEQISSAICADIDNPLHSENACKGRSSIYMPSIFFSPNGIPEAHNLLSCYAAKYSMNVLMSNFSGESWGSPAGGRSAFWTKEGKLLAEMDNSTSGLLIVEKINESWRAQTIIEQL